MVKKQQNYLTTTRTITGWDQTPTTNVLCKKKLQYFISYILWFCVLLGCVLVSIVAVTCLWMLLAPIVLNLHSATFSNMFPVFLYIGFIVALPGQILFFISSFFLRAKQKKQISYVLWATVFAFVNGISLIILLTITGLPPASGMFSELLILLSFIFGGMITGTLYGRAINYSQN